MLSYKITFRLNNAFACNYMAEEEARMTTLVGLAGKVLLYSGVAQFTT